MFGRKQREQRAAIDTFHPLHQALIWHRGISVSLRPADWAQLVHSLAGHDAVVRLHKWAPPSRSRTVLVPLIRVLSEDMSPGGVLSIAADLRGLDVPGKMGPAYQYPGQAPRVRRVVQTHGVDPWLRLRAELRDGSVLELSVTDRIRHRDVFKVSRSGKHKTKRKTKLVQRISVSRRLPAGAAARRPPTPPPPWVRVKVREGRRTLIRAGAKLPAPPNDMALVEQILILSTELFRWTPSGARSTR
jgi:hypothetical protein